MSSQVVLYRSEPLLTLAGLAAPVVGIDRIDGAVVEIEDVLGARSTTATFEVLVGLSPVVLYSHPSGALTIGIGVVSKIMSALSGYRYATVVCVDAGNGGECRVSMVGTRE